MRRFTDLSNAQLRAVLFSLATSQNCVLLSFRWSGRVFHHLSQNYNSSESQRYRWSELSQENPYADQGYGSVRAVRHLLPGS